MALAKLCKWVNLENDLEMISAGFYMCPVLKGETYKCI